MCHKADGTSGKSSMHRAGVAGLGLGREAGLAVVHSASYPLPGSSPPTWAVWICDGIDLRGPAAAAWAFPKTRGWIAPIISWSPQPSKIILQDATQSTLMLLRWWRRTWIGLGDRSVCLSVCVYERARGSAHATNRHRRDCVLSNKWENLDLLVNTYLLRKDGCLKWIQIKNPNSSGCTDVPLTTL